MLATLLALMLSMVCAFMAFCVTYFIILPPDVHFLIAGVAWVSSLVSIFVVATFLNQEK